MIRYLTFFIFVLRIVWAIDVLYTPNVFGFLFSDYLTQCKTSILAVVVVSHCHIIASGRVYFFFGEQPSWRHTETEKATSRRLLSLVS